MTDRRDFTQVSAEAQKFAAALLEQFEKAGIAQSQLDDKLHRSAAAVSRFCTGKQVAPPDFVEDLIAYLRSHGKAVSPAEERQLFELRSAALRTSSSKSDRLTYFREEVERLQTAARTSKSRFRRRHRSDVRQILSLKTQMDELERQLSRTQDGLQTAEIERDQAHIRLGKAAEYAKAVEAELQASQEEAADLRRELGVLRRQVEVLTKERPRSKIPATAPAGPVSRPKPHINDAPATSTISSSKSSSELAASRTPSRRKSNTSPAKKRGRRIQAWEILPVIVSSGVMGLDASIYRAWRAADPGPPILASIPGVLLMLVISTTFWWGTWFFIQWRDDEEGGESSLGCFFIPAILLSSALGANLPAFRTWGETMATALGLT